MKSFKKALSLLLAAIMVFSAFAVSASAEDQTVIWSEYGEDNTYIRVEDAQLGETTYSYLGSYAHRFTAEKEGLYAITMSITEKEDAENYGYSCLVSESSTDTTATDFAEFNYSIEYENVYYFEEGEAQYIGVYTDGDIENYTLHITYLGKAESIAMEDADKALQANGDIFLSDGLLLFMRGVVFHTDTGNDVCIDDIAVPTELTSLKAGDFTVEIAALGISQSVSFSVFLAEDEITSIATGEGFEAPTAYITEDGELDGYSIDTPSFYVNAVLKDGTVIENNYAEFYNARFVLADGREIVLVPVVVMEDGKPVYYLGTYDEPLFFVSEAVAETEGEEPQEPEEELDFRGIFKMIFEFLRGLFNYLWAVIPPKYIGQ